MLRIILNKIKNHICKQKNCEAYKQSTSTTASEDAIMDGVNVRSLPAKDAYAYALTILDTLLTKMN